MGMNIKCMDGDECIRHNAWHSNSSFQYSLICLVQLKNDNDSEFQIGRIQITESKNVLVHVHILDHINSGISMHFHV